MNHSNIMNSAASGGASAGRDVTRSIAAAIFVAIIVFHGTYLRIRPSNEIPTLDWVVFARLLSCAAGAAVGFWMIPRGTPWGNSGRFIMMYAVATMFSAITSDYTVTSFGYSALILGAGMLMVGMVYSARTVNQIKKIETIWLVTVGALMAKDAITGMLMPAEPLPGDIVRLGMGLTHANQISMHAAIIFWLSFAISKAKYIIPARIFQAFCLFVLVSAVSRGGIAAFIIGGCVYVLFKRKSLMKRTIFAASGLIALASVFLIGLSFGQDWAQSIHDYLVRGQDRESLTSLTGRTEIWQFALSKALESPLIGHGYGVSRFAMREFPSPTYALFVPAHSHNSFLEAFLSTGIVGLIPFVLLFLRNLKWATGYYRLRRIFSPGIAHHAIIITFLLIPVIIIESTLASSLSPVHLLFFLYLLALDRENYFRAKAEHAHAIRAETAETPPAISIGTVPAERRKQA